MPSLDDFPGLIELGWTPYFQRQWLALVLDSPPDSLAPPERVASEQRGEYTLLGIHGERRAVVSGRLRHSLDGASLPCVGDWVSCSSGEAGSLARIEHVFESATRLQRKAAGPTSRPQAIAANVDVVVVVAALSPGEASRHAALRALNPRRIERYLTLSAQSGARAIVAVNKADLEEQEGAWVEDLRAELAGVEILRLSARSGLGLSELMERTLPRETAVLVGSSGVGKSSLVNRLLGWEQQRVHATRDSDTRGRHTTTARQLFRLSNGAFLIDTPGMRELGLWADEADPNVGGFDDIDSLGENCRFRDCRHEGEPGCAVARALMAGDLSPERVESARKLRRELEWQRERTDALKRQETVKQRKVMARQVRAVLRHKRRDD